MTTRATTLASVGIHQQLLMVFYITFETFDDDDGDDAGFSWDPPAATDGVLYYVLELS